MGLNIKSERVVALVRELAARTGSTQTGAIEDAVARRLAELSSAQGSDAQRRDDAAQHVLSQLATQLTDGDRRAIRDAEGDLYDHTGLPT